jgi:hypothetical protein
MVMSRRALGFACFIAILAAGCGTPNQAEMEKTVRDGMKIERNVEIASVKLDPQPDGGFVGIATADNGDTYDVTVTKPRGGRFQWRAAATQPTIERILREKIERTHGSPVAKLELTKDREGEYHGSFALENGTRWAVTANTEGVELKWRASLIPGAPAPRGD